MTKPSRYEKGLSDAHATDHPILCSVKGCIREMVTHIRVGESLETLKEVPVCERHLNAHPEDKP